MTALLRRTFALLAAVLLTSGCLSDCCFAPENFLSLFVGVRIDSTSFRSDGYVLLELVPTDQLGETFVNDNWDISVTLEAPSTVPVSKDTQWVQPADPRPLAAAILIDDSGSMLENDPDRARAGAANMFAHQFLDSNPGNLVALADFGWPRDSSTAGFERTRVLQDFTSNPAQFELSAARIQAIEGGGSRLYHSALELSQWMNTTVSATYKQMLVIITDGFPTTSDTAYRNELYADAAANDVRILAVGIGPASDQSGVSVDSAVAVVQELASRTSGVYSGTTSTSQLLPVLTALANVSTSSQLLVLLRLSTVPAPGTKLAGLVTITGERGTAAAQWTAIAP